MAISSSILDCELQAYEIAVGEVYWRVLEWQREHDAEAAHALPRSNLNLRENCAVLLPAADLPSCAAPRQMAR